MKRQQEASRPAVDLAGLMRDRLLEDYAPASVLINHDFEILCLQGPTADYLAFSDAGPPHDLFSVARPELRSKLRAAVEQVIRSGEAATDDTALVKRDGADVPCKITVKPARGPHGPADPLLVVFEARFEAERRPEAPTPYERTLNERMRVLRAAVDSTTEGVVVTDLEGKFLVYNPAAVAIIGQPPDGITSEAWQEHYGLYLPDQTTPYPLDELPLLRAIRGEQLIESEVFMKNPRYPQGCWLRVTASPLRGETGALIGGVAVFRDITDRKQAEHALRANETRLRAIVDTAPDAIITINERGTIESCNPATERMFGYSAQELIGRNINRLMPSPYHEEHDQYLARYARTHQPKIIGTSRELDGRRKDGSIFPIDLSVSELIEDRRLFTGIIRDISERKTLQGKLLSIAEEEQRRIGQGLHDDVGQELTGLALKAETLAELLAGRKNPEQELADRIVGDLNRTRAKLRGLSRGLIPVEVDSEGLAAALDELAARLEESSGVSCVFKSRAPARVADNRVASQLYYIAQEAVTNAIMHGRPHGVEIVLETREDQIKLEVRDDGQGLPEESQRGAGSGLRIMTYRAGLIGGKLTIEPGSSGGTVVTCLIPEGDPHGSGPGG